LAQGSLDSAGIESVLSDDNMVRMNWFMSNLVSGIKLCVKQQDADAAVEVLEQPISPTMEVEGAGSFDQPSCPKCNSLDVSFETLNKPVAYVSAWVAFPVPLRRERWKCLACGHKWQESENERIDREAEE
jgi:hypothetical protein